MLVRTWPILGSPAIEEGVQFPLPGSPAPGRSCYWPVMKEGLQLLQPDPQGMDNPGVVTQGRVGFSFTGTDPQGITRQYRCR